MRKINFYSGPSVLPEEVLAQASEGILEINKQGVSIAEISHRSKIFISILEETEQLLRELLNLTEEHDVIILQGGARMQFAQIPMNFLTKEKTAAFIDTGYWAHKAMRYATYYGNTELIAGSAQDNYRYIPVNFSTNKKFEYIQLTSNNTIYGTQYKTLPVFDSPLIVDMSSDILSIERDFSNIDFAFACAQKNIGPSGVSIAIVKKSFLEQANTHLPPVFSYKNLVEKKSNYATPPVVNVYMCMLNLRWLKNKGGVQAIQQINNHKAEILYKEIDRNALFECLVNKPDRSNMNVCFFAKDEKTESSFLDFCTQKNIVGIKGHKAAGGLRASLYNAQPLSNVEYLVDVMQEFERQHF